MSGARNTEASTPELVIHSYERRPHPPWWARGGHAQTLFGHLLPCDSQRMEELPGARLREIEVEPGESLVVHELPGESGVRVLLFHGLSGDANADYMRRTVAILRAEGHEIWAVNHRGCGAGHGRAHRPYHAGRTGDLQAVLARSRELAPRRSHIVIGFSLSGNMALLHAAQEHEHQPDGLIAVNPPIDLERTTVDMGRGLSRLYQLRFLWRLKRAVREREREGWTRGRYRIPLGASMLRFDDIFTAPECGFENGRDYYRRASSRPHLPRVAVPSVIVTAADDPFVDPRAFEGVELPAHLHLHIASHGGHVGYVEHGGGCWLDDALAHYVRELVP